MQRTPVAVLGTLAEFRREPIPYDLAALVRLVTDLRPDLLCLDITPEQWQRRDFSELPPEYQDALLPLAHQTDIVVVPIGGERPPQESSNPGWRGRAIAILRRWLADLQRHAPGPAEMNEGRHHFLADLLYEAMSWLAGRNPARLEGAHSPSGTASVAGRSARPGLPGCHVQHEFPRAAEIGISRRSRANGRCACSRPESRDGFKCFHHFGLSQLGRIIDDQHGLIIIPGLHVQNARGLGHAEPPALPLKGSVKVQEQSDNLRTTSARGAGVGLGDGGGRGVGETAGEGAAVAVERTRVTVGATRTAVGVIELVPGPQLSKLTEAAKIRQVIEITRGTRIGGYFQV